MAIYSLILTFDLCLCYYKNGKKLKPKPNCNSVDLSEVEWEETEDAVFVCFDPLVENSNGKRRKWDTLSEPQSKETYCETDIDPLHHKLTQFQAVVQYLTGKEPDLECDERLLQHTLFDAVVKAPMEAYWTTLLLNTSGIDGGVETAFLGTRSGLMRMIRYVSIEKHVA
ncbi:hypothetical protein cypCar_00005103, partial [Cyprinus carpio]